MNDAMEKFEKKKNFLPLNLKYKTVYGTKCESHFGTFRFEKDERNFDYMISGALALGILL